MRIVIFFVGWVLVYGVPSDAFAAGTLVDVELSVSRDDNVSRAASSADIKSDNIIALGITAKQAWLLSPSSGILLHGNMKFDQYQHYEDLSHITANAGATYRFQPVVGYSAPVFDISAALEKSLFRNSDIREGTEFQTDFGVSSRVTDRIKLRGGLGWERRWADQGDVYAWQRVRLFGGADYRYSEKATLYANASRIDGDQVFTATPNLALFNASKAAASDPVFGTRRAYRMDATAYVLEFGDSISLSSNTTLDVGLSYFDIDADSGQEYDGTELRVSWLYRFK